MQKKKARKSSRPKTSRSHPVYWLLAGLLLAALVWLVWRADHPDRPLASQPAPTPLVQTPANPVPVRTQVVQRPNLKPLPPLPGVTSVVASASNPPPLKSLSNQPAITLPPPPAREGGRRPPADTFEWQLALDRLGFSSGPIDGRPGSQTRQAVMAFQRSRHLPETGVLDGTTRPFVLLTEPTFRNYVITEADQARLRPTGKTWTQKSKQDRLDYETILELVSELGHTRPEFVKSQNLSVDWNQIGPGSVVRIPLTEPLPVSSTLSSIRIRLSEKTLQARDGNGTVVLHFPVSIARLVEKRPLGTLKVISKASNPNYKFNPSLFPESPENKEGASPMMIPPGPNNPVGTGWIGLDRPGYGIHGTPNPEAVGRTESHGCFRLANWNVERLLPLVWVGMPVVVEP